MGIEVIPKDCARRRAAVKHGHTWQVGTKTYATPTYRSWANMRSRCKYPSVPSYKNYGGRGITVCDRWESSFENFLADMGERPEGKTLDRIDNDGNYEPSNCKWSTPAEQLSNRRRS